MRTACLYSFLTLLTLLPASPAIAADSAGQVALDEKVLKEAGVQTDGAGLLAYLRARTLSEKDRDRLAATVPRLGHRSFSIREQSTRFLIEAGRAALPFLRGVLDNPDLELARRAERAIAAIERVPYQSRMASVARLLAARRPDGTAEAILAYLPCIDEDQVEEVFLEALAVVSLGEKKVHPAVEAAVKDREPSRRAAAAYVLGRASPPRLKPLVPLLRDKDAGVRFQAAEAMIRGGDKTGVPVLIDLLTEAPARLTWRAEDLLYRIAGEAAPRMSLAAGDDESRRKCRDAWVSWWRGNAGRTDLAKIDLEGKLRGLTLYVEYDGPAGGGRVWLAGPDGKTRWAIDGLEGPNDARLLPGGRVLIAERNASRVTERDFAGKVLWEKRTESGAIAADRLPNGHTLITTWNQLLEVSPDGKTVWGYTHPSGFRHASRMRNGHILAIAANGQVVELDSTGKPLRTITPQHHGGGAGYWATVEMLPGGRFLAALGSSRKVVELDDSGRIVWEAEVPHAVFATRLRNGHTLVCSFEDRQVIELDRAGKAVSKQTLPGRPFTARRY